MDLVGGRVGQRCGDLVAQGAGHAPARAEQLALGAATDAVDVQGDPGAGPAGGLAVAESG